MTVLVSIDEINLQRLLLACERKQQQYQADSWTESEKSKFVAYIKYLERQQESHPELKKKYADRIQSFSAWMTKENLTLEDDKGIERTRVKKQQLLDDLIRLQQPDEPEWLQRLKVQPEVDLKDDYNEKEEKIEEEEATTEKKEETELGAKEQDEGLFRRRRHGSGMSREQETSNIEHVLQHHRQMHDELTTDLSRMAQQLKLNSQSFGDTLSKDDKVLREAQGAIASNLEKLRKERQRLDAHYSKSWGTSFMTMGVVLFVCITFVLVFFTIKFLPKA